jgi:hypothetical protein
MIMIAIFYISTIRPGHVWGDDFALYVMHAENIAGGKAYAETPYVHNALYPDIGPKAYPPILPVVLSPVYLSFGLNLTAMKIALEAFFLASLWLQFLIYRLSVPWLYAIGLLLLIGANPIYWDFKDEILSDFPFLFFVWLTLYAVHQYHPPLRRERAPRVIPYAILLGTCMYLAYGTRVLGAVLPASLVLYELLKFRKFSRFAVIAVFVAGILMAAQFTFLSDAGSGYLSLFKQHSIEDIARLFTHNAITYITGLSTFLDNGHSKPLKIALFLTVSLLAALGLRRRIKDGITILEVFLFLYVVSLIVSPVEAFRYLYPIIPIYFLYAGIGLIEARSLTGRDGLQYAPVVVAGLVVVSYASKYVTVDYGPIPEGIARQESAELFHHIQSHTKPDDVIIFRKPRALALLTRRRSSIYPMPPEHAEPSDGIAWNYFDEIGARYLVVGAAVWARSPINIQDIEWERRFAANCKPRCEEVFSNADFQVYELKDPLEGQTLLLSDKWMSPPAPRTKMADRRKSALSQ